MRILLVNPPSLSIFSTFGFSQPPMGLLYLAASLEAAGHHVQLRDLSLDGEQLSRQELQWADLVGISSDTTRIIKAQAIAKRAAALGKPVVMGGPHPQFLPEDILADGTVSWIVKGEGEAVLPALVEVLQAGGDPGSVDGLIYRDQGRLRETPNPMPLDVDKLPFPAWHLLPLDRYQSSVAGRLAAPVVTSRGCPGACHFCSSSIFFGRSWRARTAASVLDEIERLYTQYGYRAITFMDDNFTLDPRRVEQIADGIIQRGYDLKWWNFSRVDTIVKHPGMVAKMAAAGSAMVYLGIESGNRETLNSLGKQSSLEEIEQAVKLLKEHGIGVYGSYIIGSLDEKPSDIERNLQLAISLDTEVAQFSILTPYPGTALYQQLKERIFTRKWKFFDGLHLVFRHPTINRHHLQLLLISSFIRFYRRSRRSIDGFQEVFSRRRLSLRSLVTCVWELLV